MDLELLVVIVFSQLESMVAFCILESLSFAQIVINLTNVAAVLLDLDVYILAIY